jgi:hypothetical protein
MKISEMIAFPEGGIVRFTLVSEHPAEMAMIRLLNGCTAICEAKTPPQHDPVLCINVTVKKDSHQ